MEAGADFEIFRLASNASGSFKFLPRQPGDLKYTSLMVLPGPVPLWLKQEFCTTNLQLLGSLKTVG